MERYEYWLKAFAVHFSTQEKYVHQELHEYHLVNCPMNWSSLLKLAIDRHGDMIDWVQAIRTTENEVIGYMGTTKAEAIADIRWAKLIGLN